MRKGMWWLLVGALVCATAQATEWKRGIEHQRIADQGDGTYLNPVLAGDHPDPSVLKDGDDYYLTLSSFDAYPGLPLWHSRDLVNWQPIGHAITTNVGAIWAPDLVKHKGRYYIYFPARRGENGTRSNFVVWADRITGPWSEPIDIGLGKYIDLVTYGLLGVTVVVLAYEWLRKRREQPAAGGAGRRRAASHE